MIRRTVMTAAVAAGAGAAHAQFAYQMLDGRASAGLSFFGSPFVGPTASTQDLAAQPGGAFSASHSIGSGAVSYVDQMAANLDATLLTRSGLFSYSASGATSGILNSQPPAGQRFTAGDSLSIEYVITLTEDVEALITLDFAQTGSGPVGGDRYQDWFTAQISTSGNAFAAFIAGFGQDGVSVLQPFSFVAQFSAGDTISIDISQAIRLDSRALSASEWGFGNSGALSIQVVPAPGPAALLGAGVLAAAARRRRA